MGLLEWFRRVQGALRRGRSDADLDDELRSHLEMARADAAMRGRSPAEAAREAALGAGMAPKAIDALREQRGLPWVDALIQDAALGVRLLRRHRATSAVAIVTIALGVGSTTAMVNLVDVLMFRPPALIRAPGDLVSVGAGSYVAYQDLAVRSRTLDLAAYTRQMVNLGAGPDAVAVRVECVTGTYWPLLGTQPAMGRTFSDAEAARGGPAVAILSHGLWTRQFASDPAIVGRSVALAGRPFSVIGVAPARFNGIGSDPIDAWIVLPVSPETCSFTGTNLLASAGAMWLSTIGRVRPDATVDRAVAEFASFDAGDPAVPSALRGAVGVEPLMRALRSQTGRNARIAQWLAAGALMVLLIACANVAGVLSIRAIDRHREIVVRLQLGASRRRVAGQLMVEHLILLAIGGLAAMAVAWVAWNGLRSFFPALVGEPIVGPRSMAMFAVFACVAGAIGCVLPAVQASGANVGLVRAGAASAQSRALLRRSLLVVQVAFALVLAVCAGLFQRSVNNVKRAPGYETDRVLVATMDLRRAGIGRQADVRDRFDALLRRTASSTHVRIAGLTSTSPLGTGRFISVMPAPAGAPAARGSRVVNYVSPSYFSTVGTRIVSGRAFDDGDTAGSEPVAIVDAGLAEAMWPGEAVAGRCLNLAPSACTKIVGVSESRRMNQLTTPSFEMFYPLAQAKGTEGVPQALLIRPNASPREALAAVALELRAALPDGPPVDLKPLEDLVDTQAAAWRVGARMFGLFGTSAILLAACGIYGALSLTTRQRTPEIGVRMALGARPLGIIAIVMRQAAVSIGLGWAAGVMVALAAGGVIRSLLYEVTPLDGWSFAVASVALIGAGIAGSIIPAWRALRVDPVVALRRE